MQSETMKTCRRCFLPNCNGYTHLTKDAFLGCSRCGIELNDIIEIVENESFRSTKQCEICDHKYSSFESSDDHFMAHFYEQPANIFVCVDCESEASTELESVKTTSLLLFPCEMCKKKVSFPTKRLLKKHNQEVHPGQHKCHLCNKLFDNDYQLAYHRTKKHPKPPPERQDTYTCRVCEEETFKSQEERSQHENKTHRDLLTKLFSCSYCERTYSNVSNLHGHLVSHTNKRKHICEICGKAFVRLSHLDSHRPIHTDQKLFECVKCSGKIFKTAASLSCHVVRMHTDRPGYPCDMCDKVFKDTSDRRRHRWTHGGMPKNFACEICEKRFYEAKLLRYHMRSHC